MPYRTLNILFFTLVLCEIAQTRRINRRAIRIRPINPIPPIPNADPKTK